jgi:hypothetical protein
LATDYSHGWKGKENMSENKHDHHQHEGYNVKRAHKENSPYWARAHHDWRFWVAVFLMFAAMVVYLMSDDLSFRPASQPQTTKDNRVP